MALFFCLFASEAWAQTITKFNPYYGKVGKEIVIDGTGLSASTAVYFNGVQATTTLTAVGTQLHAWVPANATTGPIKLQNGTGQPFLTVTNFTVISNITYIDRFDPTKGSSGKVTIYGDNFDTYNYVWFGNVYSPGDQMVAQTPPQFTVTLPANAISGKITVSNANHGKFVSLQDFYAPPVITSYSPSNAPVGTTVSVVGTNFLGISSLQVGAVSASYIYTNNNRLSFVVPTGAVDGKIGITTPERTVFSTAIFAVLPTITGFTPTNGTVGTPVTITGINFSDVTSVLFSGGKTGTVTSSNANQIIVKVPAGALTGPITLHTQYGDVSTTNIFYTPPGISSFNPPWGDPGKKIVITGSNFFNVSSVKFNGTDALIAAGYSSTSLTSTVPARATVGPITLTTPGGTTTSSNFWPPPVIDSFTPDAGVPGVLVKFTGLGFNYYTNISFNGATATLVTNTSTQSTVIVPTNATTGLITVNSYLQNIGYYGTTSSVPFRIDALKLLIQQVDTNLISISWPTSAVGYKLEYVTEWKKTNSWISSTNTPETLSTGTRITVPATNAPRFYRLKSP